jgi:hypothetical protein
MIKISNFEKEKEQDVKIVKYEVPFNRNIALNDISLEGKG